MAQDPLVQALLTYLQTPQFQQLVSRIAGYDARESGRVVSTAS
jgi:hypothetical protein